MERSQGKAASLLNPYIIKFSPLAAKEVEEAIGWYRDKNPFAAGQFRAIVFDSIEIISHSPLSWGNVSETSIRKFVIPRYPYSLYFEVLGNIVYVLAVAHNRRTPRYWLKQ